MITAAVLLAKLNVFIALAAAATLLARKLGPPVRGSIQQMLVRLLLVTVLVAPVTAVVASRVFAPSNIFEPAVQIAEAPVNKTQQARPVAFITTASPTSAKIAQDTSLFASFAALLAALAIGSSVLRLARRWRDSRKLRRLSRAAFTLRRFGRVKIQIARVSIPFAARLRGEALVMLPEALLAEPALLATAIRHELQHHRQRDLQWNTLLECTRFIAGWNPLVRTWLERIEEIDELACDENLLRLGTTPTEYARSLYEIAVRATQNQGDGARLVGTARMATSPHFLKRRIEMTLSQKKPQTALKAIAMAAIMLTTTAAAWASEGLVRDRRITQAQAEKLAMHTTIPVVVNKRVLNYLNLATGSPRTRFYMRNALKRMKALQPMIEAKLAQAQMPNDLLALAAMESGFQNTETMTSAGIWQFTPETARRYDLQVDDVKDERLDPARETDAAIAYLSHLQSLFANGWLESLLGYNMGERSLLDLEAKTGVHDVFKLADDGALKSEENANYVPKFEAALIIINNPDLVNE